MKAILLILSCMGAVLLAPAQTAGFFDHTRKAHEYFSAGEYAKAGRCYADAVAWVERRGLKPRYLQDLTTAAYNGACAWSLAGRPGAAFAQLGAVAGEAAFTPLYEPMLTDPDLAAVRADKRWPRFRNAVRKNKETFEARFNQPLVQQLGVVFAEDQQYRLRLGEVLGQYGASSPQYKDLVRAMHANDSANVRIVTDLLDRHGWLGPAQVGYQGNQTLFLVIQHAELPTQEKYLPMLREAVQRGNAFARDLALLEDRVALRQGKKQTYGSQVWIDAKTGNKYVQPLADPDRVDERRAAVALEPLAHYLGQFGMSWDPGAYKITLPEIEALVGKKH